MPHDAAWWSRSGSQYPSASPATVSENPSAALAKPSVPRHEPAPPLDHASPGNVRLENVPFGSTGHATTAEGKPYADVRSPSRYTSLVS